MKKIRNTPEIKLIEKFDQQLQELLIQDLQAIKSAKVKILK